MFSFRILYAILTVLSRAGSISSGRGSTKEAKGPFKWLNIKNEFQAIHREYYLLRKIGRIIIKIISFPLYSLPRLKPIILLSDVMVPTCTFFYTYCIRVCYYRCDVKIESFAMYARWEQITLGTYRHIARLPGPLFQPRPKNVHFFSTYGAHSYYSMWRKG